MANPALLELICKNRVMKDRTYDYDPDWLMSEESLAHLSSDVQRVEEYNRNIAGNFMTTWDRNFEENKEFAKKHDIPSISERFCNVRDKTVLICSGGPSTYANIDYISKAKKDGCTIIAVDRVYSFLKENAVTPDYTVTVDPQDIVLPRFFKKIYDKEDVFVANMLQSKKLVKKMFYNGKLFLYLQANPRSNYIMSKWAREDVDKKYYCLRSGNTVAFLAIDLAVKIGGKSILITGNECGWPSLDAVGDGYEMDQVYGIKAKLINGGEKYWLTNGAFHLSSNIVSFFPSNYHGVDFIDMSDGIMVGWVKGKFEVGPIPTGEDNGNSK